ncbi:MAG: PASTA domain-containing protein [Clostridiales bacterium]|jgi:stage V sporulation protein D (sporulation-specific penicillin-binding protein)|nr:PASTA domain-containing protein [Clostridiales bacterium]
MNKVTILAKKKLIFLLAVFECVLVILAVRIFYIQNAEGGELRAKAYEQQTRDRLIAPNRGGILDRNMVGLAKTETVSSVSVIYNQMTDRGKVADLLSSKLGMDYETVRNKVEKKVALERIQTKVDKKTADEIRALELDGVVIDEDVRRIYPYSTLASQVIGFVGRDNQGIIGLEAKYDQYLKGQNGKILTETDVRGREIEGGREERIEPVPGHTLVTTIDVVLQQYTEQALEKVLESKQAKRGAIILMNPQNGEMLAMANKPDFDLNDPFTINPSGQAEWESLTDEEQMDRLNQMWRNLSINDTYEPGSTFKIITSVAGLEEGVVTPDSPFVCNGSHTVGDRQIKCWRFPRAHGAETFVEGVYASCNPVFMQVAERLGKDRFYDYFIKFGFNEKTGIDVPGEAVGIMHKLEKVGPVELATMSFGQSFQITPLQLVRAGAAVINGGLLVTPHFASKIIDADGNIIKEFAYEDGRRVISKESADTMREILEGVVYTGTGNKTYIPGYRVGGKTATSEKLPRRSGKYIASFLAFAPAESPQVIALVIIDEPQGVYYGGTVAGPVMKEILENALPYLNVKPEYTSEEEQLPETARVTLPDLRGKTADEAVREVKSLGLTAQMVGEGEYVENQFPLRGDEVNKGAAIILYLFDGE